MKKIVAFLFVAGMISSVYAQTRRIAHRSHGGTVHEAYDHTDRSYGEIDPFYGSRITWIMVVQGDSIVWKLDTLPYNASGQNTPVMSLHYHPILDVSDVGHICSKRVPPKK